MEIYEPEQITRLDYLFRVETVFHLFLGTLCLIVIYRSSCKNRQLTTFDFVSLFSVGLIGIYPLYSVMFWHRFDWFVDNALYETAHAIIWLESIILDLPILILVFVALKRCGLIQKTTKRKTNKGNSSRYVGLDLD